MKKIMIIGANCEKTPLLKKARELGYYIIATDNFFQKEGFSYADKFFVADPRDLTKMDEIFKQVKPDGVISDECDYSMFSVAYLTNKYGLPGPNMDSLMITNNKYLQRKIASKIKIKQPKFCLCMTYKEVQAAVKDLGLPVMLKPLDNRGSIGVSRVLKMRDLEKAFFNTIANSYGRQILVERLVKGQVVTVEGLYLDKFLNLSFSTKKMHPQYSDNAMYLRYPGNLSSKIVRKIYKMNEKIVKACQINFGLTHTEFIVDGDKINFLEIANRGGGVNISNIIIPYLTGLDICKLLIAFSLGKKVKILPKPIKSKGFCILHFFNFGQGRVKKIKNVKKVKKLKGVLALKIFFKKGDYLGNIKTALNRPGFMIVGANNLDKCHSIISKAKNEIIIELEKKKE